MKSNFVGWNPPRRRMGGFNFIWGKAEDFISVSWFHPCVSKDFIFCKSSNSYAKLPKISFSQPIDKCCGLFRCHTEKPWEIKAFHIFYPYFSSCNFIDANALQSGFEPPKWKQWADLVIYQHKFDTFFIPLIFLTEYVIIIWNLIFTSKTAVNMSGRQTAALINGG